MSKVRYNLHTTNGRTIIRLVLRYGGHKFVYYPGIEVKPELWNSAAQEVRRNAPNHKELNNALQRLKLETERIYTESLGRSLPLFPAELKLALDKFWKGKTALDNKPKHLSEFVRSMVEARVASGEITKSTGKAFKTLASALDRFRKKIQFAEIDLLFHKQFTAFLIQEQKAPNTIHKHIKHLKQIMDAAFDLGLTDNQAFRSRRFNAKTNETDSIYLTALEVEAIESVDLSAKGLRGEEKARDLFLLGVYTGLRYSDFSNIKPEDYKTYRGVFMVKKRMHKTKKEVAVPISDKARRILEKYGMQSPVMSGQKLNTYIKRVCEMAVITEMVKVEQTRGGVRAIVMKPKFKLVSTHTARRTFATLEYIAAVRDGRPFDSIMDITGHSSRITFLKYVRVSAEEKAAAFVRAAGG